MMTTFSSELRRAKHPNIGYECLDVCKLSVYFYLSMLDIIVLRWDFCSFFLEPRHFCAISHFIVRMPIEYLSAYRAGGFTQRALFALIA